MSLPTPNYVLTEDYNITVGLWKEKVLMAGTFIRPIDIRYVPPHVTTERTHNWFDKDKDVYCYCHYGIIAIPKRIIRKV